MTGYSHILWDFNGTILNDVQASVDAENVLLGRRNLPPLQGVEAYRENLSFPIIEYYKKLGHDFDQESYEDVAREWSEQYLIHAQGSALSDGIIDAFEHFRAAGKKQIVLSASEKNMLMAQLTGLGVLPYFDEVLGVGDVYALGKTEIALEWASREKPEKALMIGDMVHDYEVAQAIGADCILIACGHQDRKKLDQCGVPVLDGVKELLSIIKNVICYVDDILRIRPKQLQGFFVGWKAPLTPEVHYELLRGSTYFITALDGDRVVGFITALSDGVNSSFIPLLEVLPEYQGRGIGSELMRRMLAKLDGVTNVDLMCDPGMQSFYERFGMLRSVGMVLRKYLTD